MTMTDEEICSASLVKLGAAPINAFSDDTVEAEIAGRLYPVILEGLLVAYPWPFSLAQVRLDPEPNNPSADFAYAYAFPDDALRTVSARNAANRNAIYRVLGNCVVSDEAPLTLTYQRRPPAEEFPAHFVQALVARMSAELCLPLTESSSRADVLQKLAQVELRLARLIDSQQATPQAVEDFTLVGVRG